MMFLLVRSLTFEKFTDIGTDFVQVILYRVELHHGCLEHGLVQLHGVDAVILVLDFHFQTDTFGERTRELLSIPVQRSTKRKIEPER